MPSSPKSVETTNLAADKSEKQINCAVNLTEKLKATEDNNTQLYEELTFQKVSDNQIVIQGNVQICFSGHLVNSIEYDSIGFKSTLFKSYSIMLIMHLS